MVHLVSLITLVMVVKTALEDNKITMVLLVSLMLLVMIMVHLDNRVEITLEVSRGKRTLVDSKGRITLVDKREEVTLARTHRSLQMRNMEHQASHKTLADI